MDTVKKVFSEAYKPEKYMKEEENLDNSINRPVPVQSIQDSESDMFEEVKNPASINDSDSFHFEGGEETKSFGESKDQTDKNLFPDIESRNQGLNSGADNIFNTESSNEAPPVVTGRRKITDNDSVSEDLKSGSNNDEELSVYEVESDDEANEQRKVNLGLMESESRSTENFKTIFIFIILFSILAFSAAIC